MLGIGTSWNWLGNAQGITSCDCLQVRTSGIKLLFDIMTRHSASLGGEERRVWDMALPLLLEVARNVARRSSGDVNTHGTFQVRALSNCEHVNMTEVGGCSRLSCASGASTRRMFDDLCFHTATSMISRSWHFAAQRSVSASIISIRKVPLQAPIGTPATLGIQATGDLASQQWLETLEKALRGWAAYLKAILPHVVRLECFERDWARLMEVLAALAAMEGLPDETGSRKVRCMRCACVARSLSLIVKCTRACAVSSWTVQLMWVTSPMLAADARLWSL
jgi:hypothetical protein